MKVSYTKASLPFKIPATTSRGAYKEREFYLIRVEENGKVGIGECAPLPGLSIEHSDSFEDLVKECCERVTHSGWFDPLEFNAVPSFLFAMECALKLIENDSVDTYFESSFTKGESGIPINGLIWMADKENMTAQINKKLEEGYKVIKLKIGALDFDEECRVLEYLRKQKNAFELEIRVDANGAFENDFALEKLRELSRFELHSIEQPIRQGQWEFMQEVCAKSKVPVALDEELIGVMNVVQKEALIKTIDPNYLILKPTLLGGIRHCDEWISLSEKYNKGWWATSALETNIGLNAIAQWVSTYSIKVPQGLGTGQLFVKNYDLGLLLKNGYLYKSEAQEDNLKGNVGN